MIKLINLWPPKNCIKGIPMFSKYIRIADQATIYPSSIRNRHGLLQLLTSFSFANRK